MTNAVAIEIDPFTHRRIERDAFTTTAVRMPLIGPRGDSAPVKWHRLILLAEQLTAHQIDLMEPIDLGAFWICVDRGDLTQAEAVLAEVATELEQDDALDRIVRPGPVPYIPQVR